MDALGSPPPAGQVGRYRIERRLGAGGMGVVYLGRDLATGQLAAVKLIRPEYAAEPQLRTRLRREVAAASRVPRFCTAPVLAADLDADQPWIATEYVDAPTLDTALVEQGPLAGEALASFAIGVAVALRAIHQHGVVHRDLKPSNILLSPLGPRVIDFGIAQLDGGARTRITRTGALLGTPAYMAPEQVRGEPATAAVDVFAWAALVVYAATGRPPFGNSQLPLTAILHHPPDLGGLTEPLRALVAGALAKDPAARPTTDQLVDRLWSLAPATATQVVASATTAPPPPPPAPPRRPRRRRVRAVVMAGLAVAVTGAVTAGILAAVREEVTPPTGDPARSVELAAESLASVGADQRRTMELALAAWAEAGTAPARGALLSAATLSYAGRFGSEPGGVGVAVNPAGTLVAVGHLDGQVQLWDVATKTPVGDPLTGHDGIVQWLQFSPDGSWLATGSLDTSDSGLSGVRVWEVSSGRLLRVLPGVSAVAWTPDGRELAATVLLGGRDGDDEVVPSLAVWDPHTGDRRITFPTGDVVSDTAISPDGAWIAGSRLNRTVGVWRLSDGELVAELPATGEEAAESDEADGAVRLAFSPAGELVKVDISGEVTLWSLPDGQQLQVVDDGTGRTIGRPVFTPDGYLFTTGTGADLRWYDLVDGFQGGWLIGSEGTPQDLAISADGTLVVATGFDTPTVMWRRATFRLLHQQVVLDVAYHPAGDRIATATAGGAVREWDAATKALTATSRHPANVRGVAYAADGSRASVSLDGTLRVHGPSGAERAVIRVATGQEAHDLAYSPDGALLAVAASPPLGATEATPGHRIYLWDANTLRRLDAIDLGPGRPYAIAFTPDGQRLLAITYRSPEPVAGTPGGSELRAWRTADQVEEPPVELGEPQAVHLAVSPDGATVAIGGTGRTVQLHHLAGDGEVREFGEHPATIRQLAFSPDGRMLASVTTDDPVVRLWDVASGELLAGLTSHLEAPNAVVFSPDGQTLASGGPDGDVILWPTEPDAAAARLCEVLRGGTDPPHQLCA